MMAKKRLKDARVLLHRENLNYDKGDNSILERKYAKSRKCAKITGNSCRNK